MRGDQPVASAASWIVRPSIRREPYHKRVKVAPAQASAGAVRCPSAVRKTGIVIAIVALALPAYAAAESPPNGLYDAPADGCQRNALGLLTFTSPEWVFIRGEQTTHLIEGTVLEDSSHPAPGGGDLPEGHEWYDFN